MNPAQGLFIWLFALCAACAAFQPAKTVDDVAILLCDLHVADNQEKLAEAAEVFCDNEENLKKFAAKAAAILKAARE